MKHLINKILAMTAIIAFIWAFFFLLEASSLKRQAQELVDDTSVRIEAAQQSLEEMKEICREWTNEKYIVPVYPDSGNDMSGTTIGDAIEALEVELESPEGQREEVDNPELDYSTYDLTDK